MLLIYQSVCIFAFLIRLIYFTMWDKHNLSFFHIYSLLFLNKCMLEFFLSIEEILRSMNVRSFLFVLFFSLFFFCSNNIMKLIVHVFSFLCFYFLHARPLSVSVIKYTIFVDCLHFVLNVWKKILCNYLWIHSYQIGIS